MPFFHPLSYIPYLQLVGMWGILIMMMLTIVMGCLWRTKVANYMMTIMIMVLVIIVTMMNMSMRMRGCLRGLQETRLC